MRGVNRPTAPSSTILRGARVYLRSPCRADAAAFVAATLASRRLHGGWVQPPTTTETFQAYVARFGQQRLALRDRQRIGLLVFRREDDALVGAFTLGDIVRGALCSAYLGYFAFAPHAGRGYMSEAIELVLRYAFSSLGLHRLEVNVQPTNRRSLALAKRAGFVREGYSRRYLRISGRWRDHVRCALLAEDWRERRRASR
jgi:ribosomal-protein-alanine N-acetyltransferase